MSIRVKDIPFYNPHQGSGREVDYTVHNHFLLLPYKGRIPNRLVSEHVMHLDGVPKIIPCEGLSCQYCKQNRQYHNGIQEEVHQIHNDASLDDFDKRHKLQNLYSAEPVSAKRDYQLVLLFNLSTQEWNIYRMGSMVWSRFGNVVYDSYVTPKEEEVVLKDSAVIGVRFGTGFKGKVRNSASFHVVKSLLNTQDGAAKVIGQLAGKYLESVYADLLQEWSLSTFISWDDSTWDEYSNLMVDPELFEVEQVYRETERYNLICHSKDEDGYYFKVEWKTKEVTVQ